MPRTDAERVPLGEGIPPTSINHHGHQSSMGMSAFQAQKAPSHLCSPLIFWLVPAATLCIPKNALWSRRGATRSVAFSIPLEKGRMALLPNFISAVGVLGGGSRLLPALGVCLDPAGESWLPGSRTSPWLRFPKPSGGPGSRLGPVAVPDVPRAWGHAPTSPHVAPG